MGTPDDIDVWIGLDIGKAAVRALRVAPAQAGRRPTRRIPAALGDKALPDPPRRVALLARRAQVGDQPLADRRLVGTELQAPGGAASHHGPVQAVVARGAAGLTFSFPLT